MIEHSIVARAQAPPHAHAQAWTRPALPRGPSPARKLLRRLGARLAAALPSKTKECGC